MYFKRSGGEIKNEKEEFAKDKVYIFNRKRTNLCTVNCLHKCDITIKKKTYVKDCRT